VSPDLEELKQRALRLSAAEREELAQFLIESLDPVAEDADEAEIERAWLIEVERRVGEIERGEVELILGDEAFARLREKFG
jgi:putative addiction module component (TIGR02574 family)